MVLAQYLTFGDIYRISVVTGCAYIHAIWSHLYSSHEPVYSVYLCDTHVYAHVLSCNSEIRKRSSCYTGSPVDLHTLHMYCTGCGIISENRMYYSDTTYRSKVKLFEAHHYHLVFYDLDALYIFSHSELHYSKA